MLLSYLKYLFAARTKHAIHSPFVFDFVTRVLNDNRIYPCYEKVEILRKQMLRDKREINFNDLGTGISGKRRISDLAGGSLISEKYAQLLFRIANHYRPENILELGTSLGLSTGYLAFAETARKIVTIEGSEEVAAKARANFENLKLETIKLIIGNLDNVLDQSIHILPALDLVFFDANHRYTPTINYFKTCLTKKTENSIFIFDDINWSAEMQKAWREIKLHPDVTVTIDIYRMGIVFFHKNQAKEHFIIRF